MPHRFPATESVEPLELTDEIEQRDARQPLPSSPSRWRRAITAAIALTVAAAGFALAMRAIGGGTALTASTTGNGRIAFSGFDGETWQIYSVEPDGSDLARLTDVSDAVANDPAWSPDGTRIAYVVVEKGGNGPWDIWVMDADGSNARQLSTGTRSAWSPAWSPDGSQIAFAAGNPSNVYVVDVDGTNLRRLTDDGQCWSDPTWSPDGTEIVFDQAAGECAKDLYVMAVDGSNQRRLVDLPGYQIGAAWSPDGATIAFLGSDPEAAAFGIRAVDADGTNVRMLIEQPGAQQPAWSPDGQFITYMAARPGSDRDTLFVVGVDGGDARALPGMPSEATAPSWQPLPVSASPTAGLSTTASPTPVPPVGLTEGITLRLGQLGGLTAAQEAFGSLWVALISDQGRQELVRVDPATGEVQQRFPLAYFPAHEWGGTGLAVGGGAIWVAGADRGFDIGTVTRIDPVSNTTQTIELPGRAVEDVAYDSGTVWALVPQNTHGDAEVVGIDAASGTVTSSSAFHADWYDGIFPFSGAIWTVERDVRNSTVQGGRLVQVVPGTVEPIMIGGSFAEPVTDGASLWTPFFGDAKVMNLSQGIAQIDSVTGQVLGAWSTEALGYDLAFGEDGGIWFLGGDHLQRLNPSTGEIDVDVSVPGTPIFILPTSGSIWVATYEGDMIRFDIDPAKPLAARQAPAEGPGGPP